MLITLSNGENGYEINTEKPTEFPSTPRSSIPLSGQVSFCHFLKISFE